MQLLKFCIEFHLKTRAAESATVSAIIDFPKRNLDACANCRYSVSRDTPFSNQGEFLKNNCFLIHMKEELLERFLTDLLGDKFE